MEKNLDKNKIASENLCAIMLWRNYSIAQLARDLDVSESVIEKYRNGNLSLRNARAALVYDMSEILTVGIDFLLGESIYDQLEVEVARTMSSKLLDEALHRTKK